MTDVPRKRCEWVNPDDPLMVDYHDREWGLPVTTIASTSNSWC